MTAESSVDFSRQSPLGETSSAGRGWVRPSWLHSRHRLENRSKLGNYVTNIFMPTSGSVENLSTYSLNQTPYFQMIHYTLEDAVFCGIYFKKRNRSLKKRIKFGLFHIKGK